MVITCTKSYSKRNLSIKAIISVFVGFGICCAIVAIRSCRWFVFLQNETNENRLVEEWEFFPDIMNSTTSIGLFRYETNNTLIPYEVYADTTTDNLNNNNNIRCDPYPEFWVSAPDYRWKFTAQLFVMLGPIIAFQSLCLAIIGANRFWICTFLLLAMGLQTATVITAVSWCDRYWDCPWLIGAKVNLTAACSFLLGWLVAMLGLVDRNDNGNYNEQNNSRAKKKNGDEIAAYDSDDSDSISVNITSVHDKEECSSTSGEMTQVDIEDGSNDVTIYNPWMQDDGDDSIHDDHKKNNDDDDADNDEDNDDEEEENNAEKMYMKKRVSQSNQIFLDLAPKLEQRRHEMMEVE